MGYFENVKELIGRTPLVKINQHPFRNRVQIFAKLEYFNPGGSIKDRLGKKLLEEAIRTGKISEKERLSNRLPAIRELVWQWQRSIRI